MISSHYEFESADPPHTADYLTTHIIAMCRRLSADRVLDLGCGNGALCGALAKAGFNVTGCDPSEEGIELARRVYPHCQFSRIGAYDDPKALGNNHFDVVVSTEVIEHLFVPRALDSLQRCYERMAFSFSALRIMAISKILLSHFLESSIAISLLCGRVGTSSFGPALHSQSFWRRKDSWSLGSSVLGEYPTSGSR